MKDKSIWAVTGIIIVAMIIVSVFLYSYYYNPGNLSTIQSQGIYQASVTPDLARVWIGVSILKPTAKEAQEEENKIIQNIISGLASQGIPSTEIETESINLYQENCAYPYEVYDSYMPPEKKCNSSGYRAIQNLKIKTKDFSKVGTIVDIAVNNGANQINNVEFYLSPAKENEYRQNAISEATKNARQKAEAMATGSGARLGRVKSISENQYYATPYSYGMKNNIAGDAAIQEAATIMPQSVSISANVNIVYELK
jgi:uncharacterized protein